VGDVIRCRINDPRAGLRNGLRGRVSAIDQTAGTLSLDIAAGTRVRVPADYRRAGGIEHAWALTGHASQGLTVERAFVLGPPPGRHAEWGYVALSRARSATHLYIAATDADDPVTDLVASLSRPVARPPAVVELGGAPPHRARETPDPPDHPGTHRHKATLTRGPLLEH